MREPSGTPTLADAVAALRQFADTMPGRNDTFTDSWYVGEPAPAELIAHFRANPRLLPEELVDLYELMDGCSLSWGFLVEPIPDNPADDWDLEHDETVGYFYLPELRRDLAVRTDYENQYTFFGPHTLSVLVDDPQPEYGTWLVASAPTHEEPVEYYPYPRNPAAEATARATADLNRARLVFVYDKRDEVLVPGGLAEYILQGIAYAFLSNWQRVCWGNEGLYTSDGQPYADYLRQTLARLQPLTSEE